MDQSNTEFTAGRESDELLNSNINDNKFITVVSGLPRSGTSMMMKILDKGRMPLLIDDVREPDIDNPRGYYEFEGVKELERDNSWLETARGRAVKIVSPILRHLNFDKNFKYKIIFMLRALDEILASQRKMADRLNQGLDSIQDNILKQTYSSHLEAMQKWLDSKEGVEVMYVNYRDVLSDPFLTSKDICEFLGINLNIQDMALSIDNSLYRQRMTGSINSDTAGTEDGQDNEVIMERLRHLGYL